MQLVFRIEIITIVVASFGESFLQKKSGECECTDFAPDGNTSCTQLAQFSDWCESESIKQSQFCQISCNRCTCQINPFNILAPPFHVEHSKNSSYDFQFLHTSDNVNQSSQNNFLQNQTFYDTYSLKNDIDLVLYEQYSNDFFTKLNSIKDKGHKNNQNFLFFLNNDDKKYQFSSFLTNLNQKTQNQSIYQTSKQNIICLDNCQNSDFNSKIQIQYDGFNYYQINATKNLGQIDSYNYRTSNHANKFYNYSIDFSQNIQSLKTPQNLNFNGNKKGTSANLQDITNSSLSASNINKTQERNDILDKNVKIKTFQNSYILNNPDCINSEGNSSDRSDTDSGDSDADQNSGQECHACIAFMLLFLLPYLFALCYCIYRNKQAFLDLMEDNNNNNNNNNNDDDDDDDRTNLLDSQQCISTSSNQQQNSDSLSVQQTRHQISQQQNTSSYTPMSVQNITARQQHQSNRGLFQYSNFYQSNDRYNVSDADHRSENQRYSQIQSRAQNQVGTSNSTQRPAPGFSSISRLLESFPSANLKERQKQGDCGICLVSLVEDFEAGDRAVVFPCFHVFHQSCAKKWIESKKALAAKCPLCYTNLKQGRQESILYP